MEFGPTGHSPPELFLKKGMLIMSEATAKPANKFWRDNKGVVFILPWFIGFCLFKGYPFLSSLVYSFSDYELFHGISKWGLMNYTDIFTNKKVITAFITTFKYAFMTVPMKLVFALFIAYILNFKIVGVKMFRTVYYIPSILGGSVAISVLWKAIFKDDGIINMLLGFIGVAGPHWLSNKGAALFIICLLRVWQFGSSMVIFLAALKGVSPDLYEAASLDGAGKWRQFFTITVPLITPIIFYNLVTQLVQAFQEFNGPFIITQGGPRGATTLVSLLIYNNAFKQYQMGLASAQAWVLFIILMIFTAILQYSQKHWVYYSDEEA